MSDGCEREGEAADGDVVKCLMHALAAMCPGQEPPLHSWACLPRRFFSDDPDAAGKAVIRGRSCNENGISVVRSAARGAGKGRCDGDPSGAIDETGNVEGMRRKVGSRAARQK